MTAARLREAAKVLRERAGSATPGPWVAVAGALGDPADGPDHMRVLQAPHKDAVTALARLDYDRYGGADAVYIALVHPLVGLALADWLDDEACRIEMTGVRLFESPMRLADLILGTES